MVRRTAGEETGLKDDKGVFEGPTFSMLSKKTSVNHRHYRRDRHPDE